MAYKKYDTIKELCEAVKNGDIDESNLCIVLDNDRIGFYVGPSEDKEGNNIDNEIEVKESNGYYDIEKLYSLLFPKAKVEWC